ncbi:MAG: alcohol dehydrogenase catalytic domain-containing protein [Victivallaceae bacterium]|nr:alcohol dehydrogenase catalytic domain-containing protein [Victivallaceae bacterium]
MNNTYDIPENMQAWPLFGAGLENLGKNSAPCTVPVPQPNDNELLVKIDAIGLCFSDIKLIRAGEEHPRVYSEDLKTDPVIPGHEAVMTVVKVGDKLQDEYKIGQRFIIQADIYVNGKGYAYGYAIDGGMAQYSVLDQRVLNGDEGCYLLPLSDETPNAVAALLEPWTCVKASYMIENRTAPKNAGQVLIAAPVGCEQLYTAGALLSGAAPKKVTVLNLSPAAVSLLEQELPDSEFKVVTELPDAGQFEDIFICDAGSEREFAEEVGKLGVRGAIVSFIGDYPDENWAFDIGNIHYEGWFYQGNRSADLSAAYNRNVRSNLKPGGSCWLPGGAGAMGQMHTQLAVEDSNGPSRILLTDMDSNRIENVKRQLVAKAGERKIEFKTMNPADFASPVEFDQAVREFAPDGFDDIVMLVPVVPVINAAVKFLKADGLMNIFAGIPAGKSGELNVRAIAQDGVRFIGSSGSKTEHLRQTLQAAEAGELDPVTALAAIGGMSVLKDGLQGVADAKFPGKTVIFPNYPDMPLTAIGDIGELVEDIDATLSQAGYYTMATEKLLDKKYTG